jgi:GT2 family glycosyltransferase
VVLFRIQETEKMKNWNTQVQAIQLAYLETGWTARTFDCLQADSVRCLYLADREGVGSMSAAFNREAGKVIRAKKAPEFIWFVTNVAFEPGTAQALLDAFDEDTAAVHPKFASDHPHIASPRGVQDVPFVEWTAPMIRVEALREVGLLDEDMPYVGMDLDWSYRAREIGWKLRATAGAVVQHAYLRHNAPEPVSKVREQLRALYNHQTNEKMIKKYGQNWKARLWETHPHKNRHDIHVF